MDVSDWIALAAVCMAFLALVVSALSYAETKRTADANVSMAESNKAMRVATEDAASAAQVSAKAAEQTVQHQIAAHAESKSARVILLTDWIFSMPPDVFGSFQYEITIPIFNEGPAVARHVQMFLFPPGSDTVVNGEWGKMTPRSDPIHALNPFEHAEMLVKMPREYFENSGLKDEITPSGTTFAGWKKDHFNGWISYHDGHGAQEVRFWLMVEGTSGSGWMQGIKEPEHWP